MQTATSNRKMPDAGAHDLPLETREAPITAVDAENRTIDVIWTAGASVDRFDWISEQRYVEELVVSDKAVRLDRLNAGGPVLDNHDRYSSVGSMLAVVERAWIEGGKGLATIRFPKAEDDPDADRIFRKVKDKIITRLSCGYRRYKIEVDKSKQPVVWRVVDWEPFEISFVTVPADTRAQVRADDKKQYSCEFSTVAGSPADLSRRRMAMRARAAGLAD